MDTAEDTSLEEEISNVEEPGAESEPPQLDEPEEGGDRSRKRSLSDSDEVEDLPEKRARTDEAEAEAEAEMDTAKDEDLPPVIDMTLHKPVTENTAVSELPVEDADTSVSEQLAENKETSFDTPAVDDDEASVEEPPLLEKISCVAKEADEDNKSKDDESCGSSLSSEANTEADEDKKTDTESMKDQNVKEETKQSESNSSRDSPNPVDQVASETVDLGQNKNEKEVNGLPTENGSDDSSTGKSDDSEKENINLELPVDLSNDKKSGSAPDVIMLSDDSDEDSKMPNGIIEEMSEEELNKHKRIIKKLQAELRNEEAKLVLLKKLHQSQLTQQIQDHTVERPKPNPPRQTNGPPPLVRGGQQMTNSKMLFQNGSSHSLRGPLMMPSRSQTHGPPPLIMAPSRINNSHSHLMSHGMRGMMHVSTNPNLMPGFRPVQPPQQAQIQQRQEEVQTPAQRQAAAKLALRKQLEKTLLQIPPPKPPPPEMNFIPSLSCPDFIMLLGLEEVVNFIIDSQLIAKGEKNPDEKFVCNPFSCVQCSADYTPVWKREKPGSKNVICEHCVTSNQKKALKQEHTNRLKSAFVKALQQEQEIERMQAQSLTQQQQAPPQPQPVQTTTVSTPMSLVTTSPMNLSTSYKPSPEQLRQHQNFIQAHQAQLRAGQPLGMQPFGHRGPFPYQIPFTKQSDLQRQYLLDLIPRGGSMSWKS